MKFKVRENEGENSLKEKKKKIEYEFLIKKTKYVLKKI